MLAYVFWHWRRNSTAREAYEVSLRRFHETLSASAPSGFLRSYSFALRGAPWANEGEDAYEDWYLLDGSAALDPLNDAAVSGRRQAAHDEAAAAAAGGTGGLYRLRRGSLDSVPLIATWFAKPEGLSYGAFYERLETSLSGGEVALWGRQMTLGPAREFCLHSRTEVRLAGEFNPATIQLRAVWP